MEGWRAQIGYITLSPREFELADWRDAAPAGVEFVSTDGEDLDAAVAKLAIAQVDLMVAPGLDPSLRRESEQRDRIEAMTGIPTVSFVSSAIEALKASGAKQTVFLTEFSDDDNDVLAQSLEKAGLELVAGQGFDDPRSERHLYRAARELATIASGADTILLIVDGLRTFEVLTALEWDTGMRVISVSQATLWNALRSVGVGEPIHGCGRLLELEGLRERDGTE